MKIDTRIHTPIFEQIAAGIRERVAAGVYRQDETLPSMRALALQLRVNPNTVQRAYELLQREGIIAPRRGLGAFVTQGGIAAARDAAEKALRENLKRAVRTAVAANIPAVRIRRVLADVLAELKTKAS